MNSVVKNANYNGECIKYVEDYFQNNNEDGQSKNTKAHESYNKKYKSALDYFWRLGKYGGLVVAEYNNDPYCLIGVVKPNTKIENFNNKFNVTIQLQDTEDIKYSEYPVLLAVRPSHGTICEPKTSFFINIIPRIYNKTLNDLLNIDNLTKRKLLHPKMLEQMCVEYLRRKAFKDDQILKYCILRPGKNLAKIDIAGVSSANKLVYAQVKANQIKSVDHEEFKNLFKDKEENNDTINIIFCENIDKIEHKSENIIYIDIDKEVFRYFNEEDYNDGQEMIQRMIGIQS